MSQQWHLPKLFLLALFGCLLFTSSTKGEAGLFTPTQNADNTQSTPAGSNGNTPTNVAPDTPTNVAPDTPTNVVGDTPTQDAGNTQSANTQSANTQTARSGSAPPSRSAMLFVAAASLL